MLDQYFKNDVFQQESEKDKLRIIQEKYLEAIVTQKKIEEERFHTRLALVYIDQCFQSQEPSIERVKLQKDKNNLKIYLPKFENFMKDTNSKYNASTLINKI